MSPRRFDGWEPREAHVYHYDDEGRIAWVEVQREAEWSSEDQAWAEALTFLESLTCSGCGSWLPDSTDPQFVGLVDKSTCYGCRSMTIVQRDDAHKHENDKPAPGRPMWSDGLRYGVRPATRTEIARSFRPE